MTVLVGGVGELYQGDLDVGRRVVEELAGERLGPDVLVEDLHYGAIAVAQRLAEVAPSALVIVGAAERGRAPARVTRRRVRPAAPDVADFQAAMHDAGTGYVTIDLLLTVCAGLDALPARTVVLEVEPAALGPADALSEACLAALPEVLWQVRIEVGRIPLLELCDRLRPLTYDERLQPAPALEVIRALLVELAGLDRDGHWGSAFSLRDRLRMNISAGETPEGMEHEDWALWWALIEELDRLQGAEAV
ncbi:MAG: hypothetical protein M3042_12605 [Actinomycetota bacterium]|nr:hypothetical protein [Actinomycetota bacterium]